MANHEEEAQQDLERLEGEALNLNVDPISYVNQILIYDGERTPLKPFVDAVDILIPTLGKYNRPSQLIISNLIKNRIRGITFLLALCIFISRASAQFIEVNEIKQGNGFILVRTEPINIIDNFTNTIHIVNLTLFEEALESVHISIKNTTIHNDSSIRLLEHQIFDKLNSLKPHRISRGLINLHGKVLKWVGGTMDDDDRQDISNHFDKIENDVNHIADDINKQITINRNIDNSIRKLTDHINAQHTSITNKINQFMTETNSLQKNFEEYKFKSEVKENLRAILDSIEKIEDVIMVSKLGILSRSILNTKEITNYKIDINKLQNIRISVAQQNTVILIILQIPNFTIDKYYKTLVVPIPNKENNLELLSSHSEILINQLNVYEYSTENLKRKLKPVSDPCIQNILKTDIHNCKMITNIEPKILKVAPNIVITKNLNQSKMFQTCNDHNIEIKGNNVIKFEKCQIIIQNKTFINNLDQYNEYVILPNILRNINYVREDPFVLEKVYSRSLDNLQEIQIQKYKHLTSNWISASTDFIIILSIILILLTIYLKFKNKVQNFTFHSLIRQEPNLKEGGVTVTQSTNPTSTQKPIISNTANPIESLF